MAADLGRAWALHAHLADPPLRCSLAALTARVSFLRCRRDGRCGGAAGPCWCLAPCRRSPACLGAL